MKESEQLADVIRDNVTRALNEDLGSSDLTAALVAASANARAIVIARDR